MKQSRWVTILLSVAWFSSACASPLVIEGKINREALDRVVSLTSAARGIELRGELVATIIPRTSLSEVLSELIQGEWNAKELQDYQDSLNVMGLWPADVEIERSYIDQISSQLSGVYIPPHRAIYLVDESDRGLIPGFGFFFRREELMLEYVLAHEVVHALQHQRYADLVELRNHFRAQDDITSAIQAALEGDALYYGILALSPIENLHDFADASGWHTIAPETIFRPGKAPTRDADRASSIVRRGLVFPYTEGYRLAQSERTGLLDDPPISTEQVLHPSKRRESFLSIDMRRLISAFPADCRALHENTVGELGLSIFLEDFEAVSTPEAWQGWDGDRFAAAQCRDGNEFIWITQWDSETDAREFEHSYLSIAEKVAARGNHRLPPTTRRSGSRVVVASERFSRLGQSWPALARYTRIANLGDLLLIGEAPAGEQSLDARIRLPPLR